MKLLLHVLIIFLVLATSVLTAQFSTPYFSSGMSLGGLQGDVIVQNYFSDQDKTYHLGFTDSLIGFDQGFLIDFQTNFFVLSLGALYRYTGSYFSIKQDLNEKNLIDKGIFELHYIHIPILFKFIDLTGHFIETGAYYSKLIHSDSHAHYSIPANEQHSTYTIGKDLIQSHDFGLVIGVGMRTFYGSISTSLSYSLIDLLQKEYKEQDKYTSMYTISLQTNFNLL